MSGSGRAWSGKAGIVRAVTCALPDHPYHRIAPNRKGDCSNLSPVAPAPLPAMAVTVAGWIGPMEFIAALFIPIRSNIVTCKFLKCESGLDIFMDIWVKSGLRLRRF